MHRSYGHHPLALRRAATNQPVPVQSDHLVRVFAEPPGKTVLLYGDSAVFSLALRMAAQSMAGGASIAVVDGANRFNVHLLSRFARERRLNVDDFLERIFISRGFTCYQMEQAVTHRLPEFLHRINAHTALIFGLLDTFYDEQAPVREVRQILQRVLGALQQMKEDGTSLLLVCNDWKVADKEREQLFRTLQQGMDHVVKQETRALKTEEDLLIG